MTEVSATRLYLGNLPRNATALNPESSVNRVTDDIPATKAEVEKHFNSHGTGEIKEIKLMSGFGFIEYSDAQDALDVVPAFRISDGSSFMGERLTVQFARGSRARDPLNNPDKPTPRPRRTPFRMQISGLPGETSWQDLKDFARQSGEDVVYSETGRDRDGRGFVEFETAADLKTAVAKLDGHEFKGVRVTCTADTQDERPRDNRYRSRSPPGRRGYPPADDFDPRGRRGYSPPRHGYRDRTSPRRDYYDSRGYRSPPPRGPPDYPRSRRYPDEPAYDRRHRYEPEPYSGGHGRPYGGPPSPRRPISPGRGGYNDYDRRHW
ncbi:MAG: hypothetical protein M1825_002274 [Sarcosagium campestre]|nr:MAG: hypothetical protein M1825_002274 [Sarcosagium campestre]